MTDAERKLLLMVAKDMRRKWAEWTFAVSKNVSKSRERQYDSVIFTVEEEAVGKSAEDIEREINLLSEKGAS
jgi:hypothetical protein